VKILKYLDKLPRTTGGTVLAKQLARSGTSIGANMEEADGASSKNDFINKVTIARKEARETRYWLRLIQKTEMVNTVQNKQELEVLINESHELMRILSAITNKAKEKKGY